jgi:aryl-alcohol dehydrogenase-like predicted oxidoreductase/histidinol phosphatase-like enzyme
MKRIGLGCMRLSTRADRDDEQSIAVIRAALDTGATLLDTSDAYCLDDTETGHNERLIARALDGWQGDRSQITVATKGGMRRPKGAWLPDGRAKHLRDACDASGRALGVDIIDLYQLHVVDPKTSIETSVRALAKLQSDNKIREIGLCNVTVSQIAVACDIAPIASVQISLSPFDVESLRNGVAEYCRENAIRLIAYRPLGGDRVKQLAKNKLLVGIGAKHDASGAEIVLAWLMSFPSDVTPIPGATTVEHASSIGRTLSIELDDDDRRAIDALFSGRLLRVPRAERRPHTSGGDVVVVMGMPGAGKTSLARDLETDGYERLNRDTLGGSLTDLTPRLADLLGTGRKRVVLDNTYPTRASRNEIIETAWEHGARVRCVWLQTDVPNAQINIIHRMLEAHGSLPSPEIIRERAKADPRYLLPDAQFRYERTLEPPTTAEGFESVEALGFVRTPNGASGRAIILDFDELLANANVIETLRRYRADGWRIFVHAWRPQIARNQLSIYDVEKSFDALRERLGVDIDFACCPHDAGPPICWCRKPIPGPVIDFAVRHDVALDESIVVGTSAADRTMAERIGASFLLSEEFVRRS